MRRRSFGCLCGSGDSPSGAASPPTAPHIAVATSNSRQHEQNQHQQHEDQSARVTPIYSRPAWLANVPVDKKRQALSIARAVGETAPLLFTSFGNTLLNSNPFSGDQESLPLFIYRYIRQPSRTAIDRGYTGALVLMLLVLVLFVLARIAGRDRNMRRGRRRRRTAWRVAGSTKTTK